ncbi:MAG: DUF1501 domain-containing protein [Planctomycetota bacterium]|nr:DUF1501 domain-containing protein [Planctomycetota bacterium]
MDGLFSRRELLQRTACGFGSLALSGMLKGQDPVPMFPPRAKRVIFIFMQGGPSHVDTFDYKPELIKRDGQGIDFTGVRFGTFGKVSKRRLMKPLWDFKQHGECGRWVSDLFPHQAQVVDDLCFIRSMHTDGVAHGPATLFMHTGATNLVRPSMGSWISYGLGTLNKDLPGFVSLCPSATKGGPRNYASAFLPAVHQGTAVGAAGKPASKATIRHMTNTVHAGERQRRQFELLRALNGEQLRRAGADDRLEAEVESLELAWRLQSAAPAVFDLSRESKATLDLYGIGEKPTDDFGRQCLLARRMAESGVRYVQVNYGDESANPRWDQHANMPLHAKHARATDKPVAGLIRDLKSRGLLEDTLVWWGGEFGRTPFAQGKDGRDHNPRGFTTWLAGGGTKPGFALGATDDIGHEAVQDRVHMHDLHATILHILGIDHERLTYRYAGRDFRLTDVHGRVVRELFA